MYIQHAPSEITKNHIYVSILHWPSITDCWHRHTQTSHKVKTVFQYAHGYIYSGRCCQDKSKKKKKNANKYTEKIHDVQINIVQQRISKTKNYGGKRGGEREKREKKSKCFPGEIAGLAAQKLISNITFGFTVIFTFIHSKCSKQACNFSLGRGWGAKERGRTRWRAKRRMKTDKEKGV